MSDEKKNIDCVAKLNTLSHFFRWNISSRKDWEITYVMDGLPYKEKYDDDGFFHGSNKNKTELHISLRYNPFHFSSLSIWPVYFIINELPPHLSLIYFFWCVGSLMHVSWVLYYYYLFTVMKIKTVTKTVFL